MANKKSFFTFFILAIFYWACSWFGYGWYMYRVNAPGSSQVMFMRFPILLAFVFILVYLITQIILLKRRKSRWIKTKAFLTILGMSFVCASAFTVSLMRNPVHLKLFLNFLSGRVNYSLLNLARIILDAEGLDLVFCFVLAFISGQKIYSQRVGFDIRGFFTALVAWLLIISINELIQYSLPLREGDMRDIVRNMPGIAFGLLLSMRWFWREQ